MNKNSIRTEFWRWVILLACVATFGISPFRDGLRIATEKFANQSQADWMVTNVWLESTQCAVRTGAWLALCDGNSLPLKPIASKALADDPGHAFLLDMKAIITKRPMNLVDVASLNLAINFAGLISIAFALLLLRAYVGAILWVALGSTFYLHFVGVSPHPSFLGATSFSALLPIGIISLRNATLSCRRKAALIAMGLFGMAVATLIREPIGTMGLLISLSALAVARFAKPVRISNKMTVLIVLAVLFVAQTPRWVFMARDATFPMQKISVIQTHGISHNLYIGLGVVPNKFGLKWLDDVASEAVKRVDPSIAYVSPAYYKVLWQLYFERVKEDPLEVLRIYTVKGKQMLQEAFPMWGPKLWIFLILLVLILSLTRHYQSTTQARAVPLYPMTGISLAYIGFFLLQGIIAHPSYLYADPISAFVLLISVLLFETWVRNIYSSPVDAA